jgi:hypothetical protein
MKNWKLILGLFLVFFLGVITGVLGVHLISMRAIDRLAKGGPEAVNRLVMRRLSWDLRLDAAQREQVAAIVHKAQRELGEIRRDNQPRVGRVLFRAAREIRGVLNEDQAKKFDQRIREGREKLEQFESRGFGEETLVLPGG